MSSVPNGLEDLMSEKEQDEREMREDGLTSFLALSEHGHPFAGDEPRSPRRAMVDLMTYAEGANRLEVAGPWRLAPAEARRIESTLGYSPVGGWARLVSLAAGTGALAATMHGFYPKQTVRAWQDRSEAEVRAALAEGFSRFLVPPAAAAGLFVALQMHPLWGLRVAKSQGGAGEDVFNELDEHVFSPDDLEIAEYATFGTIAGFFAGLAALRPGLAYPLDAVAPFFAACATTSMQMARDAWERGASPIDVFGPPLENAMGASSVLGTASEILESVLVPAGLVRHLEDGRFVVHDVLSQVRVGGFTPAERVSWLGFVTATEPRFLVA